MTSIRRWQSLTSKNPSTPRGRRASRIGLSRARKKAGRQLAGIGGSIVGDIRTLARSYGMNVFKGAFDSRSSSEWQKTLLHYHTPEELLQLPMLETGMNASLVLVVSCGGTDDDICSMLLREPKSQWFQDLGQRMWGDDPNKEAKLQLAVNLLHDEILDRINQFGFKLGEYLMYEDQTKTGTPLTFLPLYSKQRFRII